MLLYFSDGMVVLVVLSNIIDSQQHSGSFLWQIPDCHCRHAYPLVGCVFIICNLFCWTMFVISFVACVVTLGMVIELMLCEIACFSHDRRSFFHLSFFARLMCLAFVMNQLSCCPRPAILDRFLAGGFIGDSAAIVPFQSFVFNSSSQLDWSPPLNYIQPCKLKNRVCNTYSICYKAMEVLNYCKVVHEIIRFCSHLAPPNLVDETLDRSVSTVTGRIRDPSYLRLSLQKDARGLGRGSYLKDTIQRVNFNMFFDISLSKLFNPNMTFATSVTSVSPFHHLPCYIPSCRVRGFCFEGFC